MPNINDGIYGTWKVFIQPKLTRETGKEKQVKREIFLPWLS
jgi:hypothetical protein